MEDSRASEPSLPFVWPVPDDETEHDRDDQTVPIEHVFADASGIAGIVSDIDADGVAWLKAQLCASDCKALIVIAVYAGCPTRSEHLADLLELQKRKTAHTQFRILPMTGGCGAPSNCFMVVPRDNRNRTCLFGATPNFGFPKYEATQCNVAFLSEPALTDEWSDWFDRTWEQAAPLNESTARIPGLVPARGSADAAAQWREYCRVCRNAEQGERTQQEEETPQAEAPATPGQDEGESTQASTSDKATNQSPSESIGVHRLDQLAERVTRMLGKGQQVTVVHDGAVKPVDVPISARFFDLNPEERKGRGGTVVRRQTFRISAFSKEEQRKVNDYRSASRTLINKLGLPFEKGLYWIPYEMIPILEYEIATKEKEAREYLNRIVGPDAHTLVQEKRMQIEQDLEETYRDLDGQGDLDSEWINRILDDLEKKIQSALESEIVAPVTFQTISIDLQREDAHEALWIQMNKLVLALAQFPRRIISKPNILSDITTDQSSVLVAMNIEDDSILRVMEDSTERAVHWSERDLDQLEGIADSDIGERDRCRAYFMIIDGDLSAKVEQFVKAKWSERREEKTKSS